MIQKIYVEMTAAHRARVEPDLGVRLLIIEDDQSSWSSWKPFDHGNNHFRAHTHSHVRIADLISDRVDD